jgi:hypothetical protein
LRSEKKKCKHLTKDKFDELFNISYANIQNKANALLKTPNFGQAGSIIEEFVKNLFSEQKYLKCLRILLETSGIIYPDFLIRTTYILNALNRCYIT